MVGGDLQARDARRKYATRKIQRIFCCIVASISCLLPRGLTCMSQSQLERSYIPLKVVQSQIIWPCQKYSQCFMPEEKVPMNIEIQRDVHRDERAVAILMIYSILYV